MSSVVSGELDWKWPTITRVPRVIKPSNDQTLINGGKKSADPIVAVECSQHQVGALTLSEDAVVSRTRGATAIDNAGVTPGGTG